MDPDKHLEETLLSTGDENSVKTKEKNISYKLIVLSSLILITVLFEIFFSQSVSSLSISIQESLEPTKNCALLHNLGQTGSVTFKVLIFVFILNFKNMYSAFIYTFILSFSIWLNGNLKLIWLDPRPFWMDKGLTPCECVFNYGKPSTHALNAVIIFLCLWESFCTKKTRKNNPILSYSILFLCVSMIFFNGLVKFFQNVHTLNQLFTGYMLGLSIYYFFFYIVEINLDNPKESMIFFTDSTRKMYFILGSILLFTLHLGIHSSFTFPINEDWKQEIMKFCPKYSVYESFDYESYQKNSQILHPVGIFIGALIEFHFLFDSDPNNYFNFNFNHTDSWNSTSLWKTILRTFLMFYCVIKFDFVYGLASTNDTFWTYLFLGFVIPDIVTGLFILFISRSGFRLLYLTNETYAKKNNQVYYSKNVV
jgi:hypothetical protein